MTNLMQHYARVRFFYAILQQKQQHLHIIIKILLCETQLDY